MIRSSVMVLYQTVIFFLLVQLHSFCYAYTGAEIKAILRRSAVEPSTVYFSDKKKDMCDCFGTHSPVSLLRDEFIYDADLLIIYTIPSLQFCNSRRFKLFPAYRLLLNESSVNPGLCKDSEYSHDIDDCKELTNPPGKPEPIPKIPPKEPNDWCPHGCVKLIENIPRGPKGERGDRGEKGERGDRGENGKRGEDGKPGGFGRGDWVYGAPTRKETVQRTFGDLKRAFQNFTGCPVKHGDGYYLWTHPKSPTYCSLPASGGGTQVYTIDDSTQIRSGFVVMWYGYIQPYGHVYVYRAKENDIAIALCGKDMSPVFVPYSKLDYSEIECPTLQRVEIFSRILAVIPYFILVGFCIFIYLFIRFYLLDVTFNENVKYWLVWFFTFNALQFERDAGDEDARLLGDEEEEE